MSADRFPPIIGPARSTGGLAKRIDYAFTADQFRSTGEFANDAYRITTGTANIGYRFSDTTDSARRLSRIRFLHRRSRPGRSTASSTPRAWETVRDSGLSVRLDDARGKRFTQKVIFGYHRNSMLDVDTSNGDPYTIAALIRTVPGPIPFTYFAGLVPASTTVAPPGTSLSTYTYYPFAYDTPTLTDRTNVQYQGTWTHKGGALVFGYEYERQAGDISESQRLAIRQRSLHQRSVRARRRASTSPPARAISRAAPSAASSRLAVRSRSACPPKHFCASAHREESRSRRCSRISRRRDTMSAIPNLKPETTQSYEVGLSREWLSRRLRTELSVFRNSFHNLIEYDSAVYPGTWKNVDQSWARGAEASANLRITHYLAVRGAYTRLYTKITNSITPSEIGEELVRRPKNSGSVSLELTPKRWTLIAGGRFVGERQDNDFVFGVNRNPGYQYVFVNASYQATQHLEPFVRIQNALDQQYQEALGYSALSRTATGGLRITW